MGDVKLHGWAPSWAVPVEGAIQSSQPLLPKNVLLPCPGMKGEVCAQPII